MTRMKAAFQSKKFKLKRWIQFWSHIDASGGPESCWEWQRYREKGYGQFRLDNKTKKAHRLAYEFTYGPLQPEVFVCHSCDNPPCCNPRHLWAGTCGDNVRDMHAKGRGNIRERNGMFKIPAEIVSAIRGEYTGEWGQQTLLRKKYGVSAMHVSLIVRGLARRHG